MTQTNNDEEALNRQSSHVLEEISTVGLTEIVLCGGVGI